MTEEERIKANNRKVADQCAFDLAAYGTSMYHEKENGEYAYISPKDRVPDEVKKLHISEYTKGK